MEIILLFPFGAALGTRLMYQYWQSWFWWVITCILCFLSLWIGGNYYQAGQAIRLIVGASFLGFVAPDLWEAFRAFLRQPRIAGWIITGAGVVYVLYQPKLLGSIMAIFIIILGFSIIIRPFFGRRQQRR